MKQVFRAAIAGVYVATIAAAQIPPPAIGQNGVVNAASRIAPALAGGALAPGGIFSITGVRLGSSGHTRVTLGSFEASLIAVTTERIEAILPASIPPGNASLVVTVDGRSSIPFPVHIARANAGLFSRNTKGWGPGTIDNLGADGRSENSFANPAHPGERVALTATGLPAGEPVMVMIGERAVRTTAKESRRPGVREIVLTIPTGVAQGCFVPVYIMAAPLRASNVVTVAIRKGRGACEDPAMPVGGGEPFGLVLMTRSVKRWAEDDLAAVFAAGNAEPAPSPLMLPPPAGTCTSYAGSFQESTVVPGSIGDALFQELGRGLDAGAFLHLASLAGSRTIAHERGVPGYYRAHLATDSREALGSIEFTLLAGGGKDVGPFQIRFTGPPGFEWVDRDEVAVIDRSRPFRVRWRDAPPGGTIAMVATNVDQISTATGTTLCLARSGDGRFTIPAAMLANIPETIDIPGIPYDQFYVALLAPGAPPRFQATGLAEGAVIRIYGFARRVRYR